LELQSCSLNIGVSRAAQLFALSDPLSAVDQKTVLSWMEEQSAELQQFASCEVLVGASGSFETFYEMTHETAFPSSLNTIRLSRKEIMETLDWILTSTHEEREAHPWIIPIRRRMAPIAALKTKWIIEKLHIQEIVISPCSLKEVF
jgi:exopolyphosphatase / guanosine-5'-triphosphate,3'-diphosphate pyrophosphatase